MKKTTDNYQTFKEAFLRGWQGELPQENKIKNAYFEYLSRVNRKNYNDKYEQQWAEFKKLSVDNKIKYVLREMLIWGGGIIVGGWLLIVILSWLGL